MIVGNRIIHACVAANEGVHVFSSIPTENVSSTCDVPRDNFITCQIATQWSTGTSEFQ